jgi:outer membrane protein
MRISRSILVSGLLLAAGCSTVRRARETQNAAKAPPGERTVTAAEAGLSADTQLTLPEAERLALTYLPVVVQARLAVAGAEEQTRQALSSYWPSVTAGGGVRRATSNTEAARHANKADSSYSAELSASQLLFDFGKTPAQVRQAAALQRAAEQDFAAACNDAVFAVRSAFYNLGKAAELLRVSEETVRQYEVRRDQVKGLVEVGRRIRYDLTKAEVDLGNAMLSRVSASNDLATARAGLNRALGLAEEPGYRIAEVESPPYEADASNLLAIARERQPELEALREAESAAYSAVDEAIANLYPSFSLSGSYNGGGGSWPLVWNWGLGLNAAATLFNGRRNVSAVETAALRLRSARAAVAAREQQIQLDLRSGLSSYESSLQRRELTALIVKQARESLNLIQERYRVGKATSVEVTDAQVALSQALGDEVKARFDYLAAIAAIKHTIGER